ncbi:MAG: 30S ribosomal protein S12 methylthiotransferase RimO, partial [Bacteroidales bacterium]
MKGRESRTVQLVTLGCSKNRVDSEHLLRQIALNSFTILPSEGDFFSLPPQILIINSCGFIKDAKEESLESILLGVEAKKRGLVEKLYVFGCLSQRYKEELRSEIPEVDHFFGVFERESIAQILGFRWSSNLSTPRLLTTPPPT